MKNIFDITEEQKQEILLSIQRYISQIDNPHSKRSVMEKINFEDFKNKLVFAFVTITFLSQTCVLSLKKMIDDNLVYVSILEESKDDLFEIKEFKVFMLNHLIDERLPKSVIDKDLSDFQLKEYRRKIGRFKGEYLKLFEDKSTIN